MRIPSHVFLVFLIFAESGLRGQSFQTLVSTGNAYGTAILQTFDKGYIVTGSSQFNGVEAPLLTGFDNSGKLLWTQIITESSFVPGNSIIQTADGGYMLSGNQLVKFDSLWKIEWYRFQYRGKAIQTSDGGYAVLGSRTMYNRCQLSKLDNAGELQWHREWRNDPNNFGLSMSVMQAIDGYYVCGLSARTFSGGTESICFTKISLKGNIVWNRTVSLLNGLGLFTQKMIQTFDGHFVIIASSKNSASKNVDLCYLKFDTTGRVEWVTAIDALNFESASSIAELPDHSLVIAGTTAINGEYGGLILTSVDEKGNLLTARRMSFPLHSVTPYDIIVNTGGIPVITGGTDLNKQLHLNAQLFLLTIDDNMCSLQNILVTIDHPTIRVDSNFVSELIDIGETRTTSYSIISSGIQSDFCSFLSMPQDLNIERSIVSLSPNPLSSAQPLALNITNIFPVGNYELYLREALGKEVFHQKKQLGDGVESIIIPTGELPNGIYTVELLDANSFASVWRGKVVKVK